MNILPNEIIKEIKNFCCIKKCNNINSRDFLIILKTNKKINKEIENEIILWLTNKLLEFLTIINEYHTKLTLIYETYNINPDDSDDNDEPNEIKILIHLSKPYNNYETDNYDIICINEYPIGNLIEPINILNILNNEHKYINKIGVSGISEKLIKDLWWNMINEYEGFMKYKSYCITQNNGIWGAREESFNFGWIKYPPKK
jgi:hypothetical protein